MKKRKLREAGYSEYSSMQPVQQQQMKTLGSNIKNPAIRNTIANLMKSGNDFYTAASLTLNKMREQGIPDDPDLANLASGQPVPAPPAQMIQKYGTQPKLKGAQVPQPYTFGQQSQGTLGGKESLEQKIAKANEKANAATVADNQRLAKSAAKRRKGTNPAIPSAVANQKQQAQLNQPQADPYAQTVAPPPMSQAQQVQIPQAPRMPQIQQPQPQNAVQARFRPGQSTPYQVKDKQQMEAKLNNKVKNLIIEERNRRLAKRILKEQIQLQIETRKTAAKLLVEMPSVWNKIKSAGSAVARWAGGGVRGADLVGQDPMALRREEMVKKAGQEIQKRLRQAEQERRKFNSNTLKSAEMAKTYHNAVIQAFAWYKRYEDTLGPQGMEFNRQINVAIEALEQDLMAEIKNISAMLRSIKKKDQELDLNAMLKAHEEQNAEKMNKQAEIDAPGPSSFKKLGVGYGDEYNARKAQRQGVHQDFLKDLNSERDTQAAKAADAQKGNATISSGSGKSLEDQGADLVRQINKKGISKEEKKKLEKKLMDVTKKRHEMSKPGETENERLAQSIMKWDRIGYNQHEAESADVDEIYKELLNDLTKRLMDTSISKEERKNLIGQIRDLKGSRKEKQEELKRYMSGHGIRSKAGMTALRNSIKR